MYKRILSKCYNKCCVASCHIGLHRHLLTISVSAAAGWSFFSFVLSSYLHPCDIATTFTIKAGGFCSMQLTHTQSIYVPLTYYLQSLYIGYSNGIINQRFAHKFR